MKNKILLVDGHSILNRAFYALPILTNSEGLYTNAVYGFLNILFKILDEEKPTHIVVAFDVSKPTFRHEQYKDYKGTRKGMPDELREQVPIMKEVLQSMNIITIEVAGFEADDVIGTIAKISEENGFDVTILSGDRDLLQLVTQKTKIKIPKTKKGSTEIEEYYHDDVINKYGVTPIEYIDVKGLMGDPSDNIPGVPGIGEKTAIKIIKQYKTIENAYEHIEDIKPKRAYENLKTFYEQAILSKNLATIKTDCSLNLSINNTLIHNLFNKDSYNIFNKLDFKRLLSKFNDEININNENTLDANNFKLIEDKDEFKYIFSQAKNALLICISFIGDDELLGISLCYSEDESYFLPITKQLDKQTILKSIYDLIGNKKTKIIMHNAKKQLHLLEETSINNENLTIYFDTSLAAYLCNPLKETYYYYDLANDYLNINVPSIEDFFGKGKTKISFNDLKKDTLLQYACYQTLIPFKVYELLDKRLQQEKMDQLFYNIEMPLLTVLYAMEKNGIKVNANALTQYSDELSDKINIIESQIFNLSGEVFNINSPKQLGKILFDKLKLPIIKKTKTGYSTAQDVLDKLINEHPIIKLVIEYRQLVKLKTTYADGLYDYINKQDNRIHSSFNQTITATGRLSSTEPNLQNIPIKLELGRAIRKVFVPEKDYVFVDADYSQIELRLLAHLSEDDILINAYHQKQDIHQLTASQVFHVPFDKVTSLQRSNAKAVNFGIVYGISAFSLSQDLKISRKEAETYINNYFDKYKSVKLFLDNSKRLAKDRGYAVTMFNRKRPIPEIKSKNFMQRSFGERVAMNSPIQGSAADIIKIAMIKVYNELKKLKLKSRLILQVHDELLIETHKDELEIVKTLLKENMESAIKISVPLDVELNVGENWYQTKK